ncbi:PREDICTED: B3 domain-containing protein Os11g0197600-like [Tarenaya hassleriana]|uniref:B3 domain-containing protein Os11g0197600-like n=1 Tax=Tarenaya hassleriana TaxID=28532 RepID=UPI00053C525E|nr:PREDICTED: B3 domain-containing protein Os11g0197600-like [Tarenaya hassleriana]
MEGRNSGWVSLLGPSGNTWHVELIHQGADLFFNQGWPAFVRDHYIECGDSMVFRYNGEWHFTVQVFDSSSCEKEAAFYSKCYQEGEKFDGHMGQKRGRNEAAHSLDVEGLSKRSREMSCGCSSNGQEANETHYERGSELEEKELAENFTSPYPYFVRTMKKFNVSGSFTLNVPYKFSMEHLPNCKTEIVLRDLKGVCWTVNSVPTTKVHTSHTFCGGWLAFVRSNGIKTGDICIFELVRKYELLVHIFRVGKEEPGDQSGKGAFSGLDVLSNATSRKILESLAKKSIKSSSNVHSKSLKSVYTCDKTESKTQDKRKLGSSKSKTVKVSKCASDKSESNGSSLRFMLALDEQKAAQSFTSAFPNFVRIMRKFNISGSYTLKIPHQFSMAYLPHSKAEIILRNSRGESWTVNSVPDSKGRMVHTFCGGWMAFVRDNDIQMGDTCIFELTRECEMRVHISRYGKKGMDTPLTKSADGMSINLASGIHPNF